MKKIIMSFFLIILVASITSGQAQQTVPQKVNGDVRQSNPIKKNGIYEHILNQDVIIPDDFEGANFKAKMDSAIAYVGANNRAIRIKVGPNTLSANLTIPSNVTLIGEGTGSKIAVAAGYTLTINGAFENVVFDTTGTVDLSNAKVDYLTPEMLGDDASKSNSWRYVYKAMVFGGGKPIKFNPNRVYNIENPTGYHVLRGYDINWSSTETGKLAKFYIADTMSAFSIEGSYAYATTLSENAIPDRQWFLVTSAAEIFAGDLVELRPTKIGVEYHGERKGEIKVVDRVNGDSVFVTSPIYDYYDISASEDSTVNVRVYRSIDVNMKDLEFYYDSSTTFSNGTMIEGWYWKNFKLENVKVSHSNEQGIRLNHCWGGDINSPQLFYINEPGLGYGIYLLDCENISIRNINAFGCRSAIDMGTYGSRKIRISGGYINGGGSLLPAEIATRGIGTHQGAEDIIVNGGLTITGVHYGVVFRGADEIADNLHFSNISVSCFSKNGGASLTVRNSDYDNGHQYRTGSYDLDTNNVGSFIQITTNANKTQNARYIIQNNTAFGSKGDFISILRDTLYNFTATGNVAVFQSKVGTDHNYMFGGNATHFKNSMIVSNHGYSIVGTYKEHFETNTFDETTSKLDSVLNLDKANFITSAGKTFSFQDLTAAVGLNAFGIRIPSGAYFYFMQPTGGGAYFRVSQNDIYSLVNILLDNNKTFAIGDGMKWRYNTTSSKTELIDPSNNVFLSITDNGGDGTFNFNGAIDITNDVLKMNTTQVLTTRQAAVADVSGTAGGTYTATEQTLINSLVTQLNALLARIRTHGLISP